MLSRDETQSLLKEYGALQEGHFVLSSGKHSEYYLQSAMLTQYPYMLSQLLDDPVIELKNDLEIDTVLTAALGGVPIGQQVSFLLGCRSIFAERDDDNELKLKRGFTLEPGEKILLAEDVVTTGGTLEELRNIVDEYGGSLVGVFVLFNRSGRTTLWDNMKVRSAFTIEFPVYEPENCPLCREAIPTSRPGTKKVEGTGTPPANSTHREGT